MSSPDRIPLRALGLLTVAAALLSACSSGASGSSATAATTSAAMPADGVTRRLAEVEFARQCAVPSLSFASESAITADLDSRLTGAGLTHAQWKRWHDALVRSPQLVGQFQQISAQGCPKA